MNHILVVEDEPNVSKVLETELIAEGYAVEVVWDGQTGLNRALSGKFDLILLDLMLPKRDGYSVCRELRAKKSAVPILMLTAKGAEAERVVGLDLGADDYVIKPFSSLELMARVRALLRRTKTGSAHLYAFGTVEVDFDRAEVRRDGQSVALTATEYQLLSFFIRSRRRILPRSQLLDHVWRNKDTMDRVVDNCVMHLRDKLEPDPQNPTYFISVRGLGYRFDG